MKKVVVTGGAGFIGSHLTQELIKRGSYVVIVDDLSTGNLNNVESVLRKGEADFIQGTVTDLALLQKAFDRAEYVFHQAAIPSVPRSIEYPLASHEANITGTLNVLLAARDAGIKKVVYASSSSVYGDTPTLPKKEEMIPRPQSPYAVTKLAGEYYCQTFQDVYALPTACLRYFNVYGPRQDPNSQYAAVVPKFIQRIAQGIPPMIFGDGEQTRDFTFIGDVVEANILAAESDATGVFNIGRGERITVRELAGLTVSIMGRDMKPVHHEPRPGDVRHSLADITRAMGFGYSPAYDVQRGLKETIALAV